MLHRNVSAAVVVVLVAAGAVILDALAAPERFTAFAVSLGGPRMPSGTAQVEITVTRWSTDEERQRLIGVLKEKGPDALLEALRDLKPVGTISTPGNVAYDLHYANEEPAEDGGRRIFLATDRPISFWEAVNQPRISEYPFTFIELRMDGEGEGEGKLSLATRVEISGNIIQLVNYNAQPVQLAQVRRHSK